MGKQWDKLVNFFSRLINSSRLLEGSLDSCETLVFAHRGAKATQPENTLASFKEAIAVGAEGIELDVHLSKDNRLIVIHDEKVNRTTDGKGYIKDLTLEELKVLDAGSWFGNEFSGERLPTLDEVLNLLEQSSYTGVLNIEIKTDKIRYEGIEQGLAKLMSSFDWSFDYIYSSFEFQSLELMNELSPGVELDYLMKQEGWKYRLGVESNIIDAIHPSKAFFFKKLIRCRGLDKPIRLWTVNSEREMAIAFRKNVAGVMTDDPKRAIEVREEVLRLAKE